MSSDKKYLIGIGLAAFNAAFAAVALLMPEDYDFIRVLACVSFGFFGLVCLTVTDNILLLARTFILGFIGYFPMMVKVLLGQDMEFSGYEPSTQGFDIVVRMYVVTSAALLSNAVGIALAWRTRTRRVQRAPADIAGKVPRRWWSPSFGYWQIAALIGVGLALFSAYMFVHSYNQSILTASYGDEQSGEALPFGSVGVLGALGIFSIFVAGMKGHLRGWRVPFVVVSFVFIVYSQLFMGLRQDAMSTMFGLVVLYGVTRQQDIRLKLGYVPLLALAYVFFEAWAVARSVLSAGVPLSSIVSMAFTDVGATSAVRLGTVSPIATTFANTVYMIDHHMIDLSYGKSYFEWLLRIPPEALYPGRPKDYALMFERFGLMTGGGFFELGEVYMNFGVAGAFVLPGIVSFAMARTYYYTMARQTMFSYFLLFGFLAIFLRGTWYQTFAFFRAFLVCMCAYLAFAAVVQVLRSSTRGSVAPRQPVVTR